MGALRTLRFCVPRAAALAAAVVLLGAAEPPNGWLPPTGWTVESVTGRFGGLPLVLVWMGGRSDGISANINVLHDETHSVVAQRAATDRRLGDEAIGLSQSELRCALGAGYRYAYRAVFGAHLIAIESEIVPDAGGGTYVATYVRPAASDADPEAVGALERICRTPAG